MKRASNVSGTDEGVLGILGGMGPEATVNFSQELLTVTPAEEDQDHLETIVYNDPKIPDRNEAILGEGESPLPRLKRNARRLENTGAQLLALPCNTAHYYYQDISSAVDIDIVHMVEEVKSEVEKTGAERAGLLATTTVFEADVYGEQFEESSVELLQPDERNRLMECIYSVKSGHADVAQREFDSIVSDLGSTGVDCIIVGCTDLSILDFNTTLETFDPIKVLARECISRLTNYS